MSGNKISHAAFKEPVELRNRFWQSYLHWKVTNITRLLLK